MAAEASKRPPAPAEPNHLRRFLTIWLTLSVIAVPLLVIFLGPEIPPGKLSKAGGEQVTDYTVLLAMSTPILLLIIVYIFYAVINFRAPRQAPGEAILEGPAVRGDAKLQMLWIVLSSALVLSLAGYGTTRLFEDDGSGSGSGPNPVTRPSGHQLRVQVIAQQWYFTYRWPQYGGVETPHLYLPVGQSVEFNVIPPKIFRGAHLAAVAGYMQSVKNADNIAIISSPKNPGRRRTVIKGRSY
jgi:cytochrome c oxidase subunit II